MMICSILIIITYMENMICHGKMNTKAEATRVRHRLFPYMHAYHCHLSEGVNLYKLKETCSNTSKTLGHEGVLSEMRHKITALYKL